MTAQTRLLRVPRCFVAVAVLCVATLAGCDSATSDTVVLSDIRAAFSFEFEGSDLVTGRLQDVSGEQSASLESQLADRGGFTLDEIVSTRVSSATIELVQPTVVGSGIDLRFMREVVLQLRAGATTREVASRIGFTSEEPANLNVIQERDVSGIVGSGSFEGVLQLDPVSLTNTSYVIEVVVRFTVEVEGV